MSGTTRADAPLLAHTFHRTGRKLFLGAAAAMLLYVMAGWERQPRDRPAIVMLMVMIVAMAAWIAWRTRGRPTAIELYADALVVVYARRREQYAWSEVHGISPGPLKPDGRADFYAVSYGAGESFGLLTSDGRDAVDALVHAVIEHAGLVWHDGIAVKPATIEAMGAEGGGS